MTRIVFLSIFLFFNLFSFAQTKEEVVQSVRDRYYRITGGKVDLENYSVGKYKVSAENDKVAIIKEEVENGRFEYYFDANNKLPYFIYFASKNNKVNPDLIGYYNDNGELEWFKENKEESEISFYQIPHKYLYLQAMNAYNTVKNSKIAPNPQIKEIDSYIQSVYSMEKKVDTLAYESDSEQGYYQEWDLVYFTNRGEKVMSKKGAGGDHGFEETFVYFRDGEKVCEISIYNRWMGPSKNTHVVVSYFHEEKLLSEEQYKSYGSDVANNESPYRFNMEAVVPEKTVY